MSTEIRPAHSPLGASGAERWMNCAGSVALLKQLKMEESDEPDYRAQGTAAHAALDRCLNGGLDAWEIVGETMPNGIEVNEEIATSIQVFIDTVRPTLEHAADVYIEQSFDAPNLHPLAYGTIDCGIVWQVDVGHTWVLDVNDYKHGEGILVDVEWNPQVMYYAYLVLRRHPEVEWVRMRIIQPRIAWAPGGTVREWECSADTIRTWAEDTLKPAMIRTEMDDDLNAGPWCRFCPAKLVCPLMTSLFGAAMNADPKGVVHLSDESLGRSYQYTQAVRFYLTAMETEAMNRLNRGGEVPGVKLVLKKANRVLRAGAEKVFIEKFGDKVLTEPEIKSPAELEKLGPDAKKLVHEYAYTPQTGLTIALASDKRPAVKVETTIEAFPAAIALAAQQEAGQ